jgi:signal peptidase II
MPDPSKPNASSVSAPAPWLSRLLAYRRLLVIAAIVLIADQLTKLAIVAHLPFPTYGEGHGAITVIRNFFYIVHVGNTGAAWSQFSPWSRWRPSSSGVTP